MSNGVKTHSLWLLPYLYSIYMGLTSSPDLDNLYKRRRRIYPHSTQYAPCKGMDSLRFWIPRCGFGIPGTGFQYLSVRRTWIPNSLSCIPDSKTQDSRFHEPNFPGFRCYDLGHVITTIRQSFGYFGSDFGLWSSLRSSAGSLVLKRFLSFKPINTRHFRVVFFFA